MKYNATKRLLPDFVSLNTILIFLFLCIFVHAQSRIHYANKNIFLSGTNVAWINFAGDIGPNAPDLTTVNTIFQAVRQNGGNALRLWLHTNGTATPAFDANGFVNGPGTNTIKYLQQILDAAAQNHVGLQLCLWSFDMLSTQEGISASRLTANTNLLTDTAYTNAYIRNCLIPMVNAVKGRPALLSWEVFNEPEGMSNVGNYGGVNSVNISYIQRVCNLVAGAIHRTDPTAIVTNGSGSLSFCTDITPVSKASVSNYINSLSPGQKQQITDAFNASHRTAFTVDGYMAYILKIAAGNFNYYRDDRLIAAGSDTLGTLDFYNTHFYGSGGNDCPFTHPCSTYALTKPLVIAEFYDQTTVDISYANMFEDLYLNGYAGALSWSWTEASKPITIKQTWPLQNMKTMFDKHRSDVQIFPITGSIYSFAADNSTIQKGDSTILRWDVETASTVTLNGKSVSVKDTLIVNPSITATYTLAATGQISSTQTLTVTVLPTGRIISFTAMPLEVGVGENTLLKWQVVKNSTVRLNGKPVKTTDSLLVYPDSVNYTYTLVTQGDESDSISIVVSVLPVNQVDRAAGGIVTTSSNDTVSYSFSNPANITDGSIFTRWQAAATTGEWAQIDMGRNYNINKVVIYWYSQSYASQYSLQSSEDLQNWQILSSKTGGTGGTANVETLDNLQGTGRYIILLLQKAAKNAFSIRELEVYGTPKATGVAESQWGIPKEYELSQNYPNPFNPSTIIEYAIPKPGNVKLTVYNILGQQVAELINEEKPAGTYSVSFSAAGRGGTALSSGIYFYTLRSNNYVITKKMIFLK
jgi:hypothetical protein